MYEKWLAVGEQRSVVFCADAGTLRLTKKFGETPLLQASASLVAKSPSRPLPRDLGELG